MSTSGYYDWRNRCPSKQELRKQQLCKEIERIHKESYEIYGAPKITQLLKENNHPISQKTVTNYMKELDIKAHYRKKWIATTVDSDFSSQLKNILKEILNQKNRIGYGVVISPIYGQTKDLCI